MPYGSDAGVQKLIWGESDTAKNNATTQARTTATSYINAFLNRSTDIPATVPAGIDECCNLLAAGIIEKAMSITERPPMDHWAIGKDMLELIKGDNSPDNEWGVIYTVSRE